jgi:HlyD family secretion protein
MKRLLTRFGWVIVLVLLTAGLVVYEKTRPIEVETALVRRGPVQETITQEAETQLHVDRLVTADRAGVLRRIDLEEGGPVSEGEVIAAIEDTELQLSIGMLEDEIAQVEAQLAGADVSLPKAAEREAAEKEVARADADARSLEQQQHVARADLEYARKEYERLNRLGESGVATDQQVDMARRDLDVAAANVEVVARQLEAARTAAEVARLRRTALEQRMGDTQHLHDLYAAQLDRTKRSLELLRHEAHVRSPIDGVVLEKHVDGRRFVQPGEPLLRVGDPRSIEIRADVLSDDARRVEPGQEVHLVGRAVRASSAVGRVAKVYPSGFTKISSLGVEEQRVTVLVEFDNSSLKLGPGYELDVKIVVAARDEVVLVPTEAVFATAEGSAVFVVRDGRARLREVRTGLTGEDDYEVIEGLQAGDVVILRPPVDLEPGARVAPLTG